MKFSDDTIKNVCRVQLQEFLELCDQAKLNGGSQARILGISRSRLTQLQKAPDAVLTATPFLNLQWALGAIKRGLAEGWLPVSANRGKAQEAALEQLATLAGE